MEKRTVRKVSQFLIDNKDVPTEQRAELVDRLTAELVTQIYEADPDYYSMPGRLPQDRLWTWQMRMPALMRKEGAPRYSIAEVLAEYILKIDQVAERAEDYPVYNVEKELREQGKRDHRELSILNGDETDDDRENMPGVIYEETFNTSDPFSEMYADPVVITAEEMIERLRADKRAKRLDLTRVKTCVECGNGFYARDRRQIVCDVMPHPQFPELSYCQVERDRLLSVGRKRKTERIRKDAVIG